MCGSMCGGGGGEWTHLQHIPIMYHVGHATHDQDTKRLFRGRDFSSPQESPSLSNVSPILLA